MKHLQVFASEAEFQTAVEEGSLVAPYVADAGGSLKYSGNQMITIQILTPYDTMYTIGRTVEDPSTLTDSERFNIDTAATTYKVPAGLTILDLVELSEQGKLLNEYGFNIPLEVRGLGDYFYIKINTISGGSVNIVKLDHMEDEEHVVYTLDPDYADLDNPAIARLKLFNGMIIGNSSPA